jgi:lipopolysaccharide export system protein LptC
MSERAEAIRRKRRRWAAAGSSHDRVIARLRLFLPAAIGLLVALLAFAPLTVGRDISFVLAKDRVQVARERMRVTEARYRGEDSRGQPFQLTARSAVQTSSRDPIVRMDALAAEIGLRQGPATITADRGRYNMETAKIGIDGPVLMQGAGGYRVETRDVVVDLNAKNAVSRGAVDGRMPLGNFRADRLRADLDAGTVSLDGGVRLHIVQRQAR